MVMKHMVIELKTTRWHD